MKALNIYEIIKQPLVTEKNTILQAQGKYVFEVADGASKHQIKQAVEKAFNVKVVAVNVMLVPGRSKRAGRKQVLTQPWKKAVVTLRPGDKIVLFEGV